MLANGPERSALTDELRAASNGGGGWSYSTGKTSRLEPTCWALLALAANSQGTEPAGRSVHRDFLAHCQRPDGWLVEDAHWPVNIGFNAFAAFTLLSRRDLASEETVQRLLHALTGSKGVQTGQSPSYRQDNSIQGWSWMDATFSWVEPTAWGALALKKAARTGVVSDAGWRGRIQDAERLLVDRCCRDGGWNFGNANVMGQDLYPHVPPTALALIALQDRRDEPAVVRSLAFLESHWVDELSMIALGFSMIALSVFGRPVDQIEARLRAHLADRQRAAKASDRTPAGNLHGLAVALTALSIKDNDAVFRI